MHILPSYPSPQEDGHRRFCFRDCHYRAFRKVSGCRLLLDAIFAINIYAPSGDPLSAAVNLLLTGGIKVVGVYFDRQASRQFLEEVKTLLVRLTEQGYLKPLLPESQNEDKAVQVGWIMTQQGNEMFFSIYQDVGRARDKFDLSSERLDVLGVQRPLVVNVNSQSKGTDIRSRLGATWPAQDRESMLQRVNPFQHLPTMAKKDIGRHTLGMVKNSVRSPAHKDLLLTRILGLAQFCGFGEISLADLIELMAHACHYEKVARRYIATALGVHHSVFTGYALADCLGGQHLGSLENPFENFAQLASGFYESLVTVGVIENGKAKISREKEMQNVRFKIDRGTSVKETEPIYMISGWASALIHRPNNHPHVRSITKDFTVGLVREVGLSFVPSPARSKLENVSRTVFQRDVHGNACYYSSELEFIYVRIKRTPGGKLVGKVAEFGDYRPPPFGGQGIFGVRCGCEKPDAKKVIRGSSLNGCSLQNVYRCRGDQKLWFKYGTTTYIWTGGDLPMILFLADSHVTGTYIQVPGECVYCATSRALGTGCSLIIAGGW